jgi:hypothetical protein
MAAACMNASADSPDRSMPAAESELSLSEHEGMAGMLMRRLHFDMMERSSNVDN